MDLNSPQKEAVYYESGPVLVLAGAGSGKTRVITNRIVHLINNLGVHQSQICSVTFTNKAAHEMKDRIRSLLGKKLSGIFLGTFHSLGLKIIKENMEHLPIQANFTIQNREDQLSIVNQIQNEFRIDNEVLSDKLMLWVFSQAKNTSLMEKRIPDMLERKLGIEWSQYFVRYQEYLRNYNSVDFDDLILLARDVLLENSNIVEGYQKKWEYFLVDEFQDTNPLQFEFLKLLIKSPYNLCAVGDDDQSIYGWRGADIQIILNFKKTFENAKIIFLEQNYRSQQYILDLANASIQNNSERHEKKLWSSKNDNQKAFVFEAEDIYQEAEFVVDQIISLKQFAGVSYKDIVILFRTNFSMRPFEEELRKKTIPYFVSGGYQFYERKEIKDMMAYIRFFANQKDEKSLIRILNFPKRNIGDSIIQKLKRHAFLEQKTFWQVIEEIEACPVKLSSSALSGILEFRTLIVKHQTQFHKNRNLAHAVNQLIEDLHLDVEFQRQALEDAVVQSKILNIRDLTNGIYHFENSEDQKDKTESSIYDYLQYISMLTSDTNNETNKDQVHLMTIHLAKGLEFDVVFLAGLEDGNLPHKKSIEKVEENEANSFQIKSSELFLPSISSRPIEEERRLFYVGITRSKEKLFFSYSLSKKTFSEETLNVPSRFLFELPPDLLDWTKQGEAGKVEAESVNPFESMLKALEAL